MTSDLTESKAFEGSFVQEIAVEPRIPTVRYTIPTPPDSPVHDGDAAVVELPEGRSQHSPDWLPGEESNLH